MTENLFCRLWLAWVSRSSEERLDKRLGPVQSFLCIPKQLVKLNLVHCYCAHRGDAARVGVRGFYECSCARYAVDGSLNALSGRSQFVDSCDNCRNSGWDVQCTLGKRSDNTTDFAEFLNTTGWAFSGPNSIVSSRKILDGRQQQKAKAAGAIFGFEPLLSVTQKVLRRWNCDGYQDSHDAADRLNPRSRLFDGELWPCLVIAGKCPRDNSPCSEGHQRHHRPVTVCSSLLHRFPQLLARILPSGVAA